ncbi:uncharacterized protein tnxbb isoform X2 [Oryzias latipes]
MLPLTRCLLSLVLLAGPALLTPSATRGSEVRGQHTTKHEQDYIKVVISEGCVTHGNSSEGEGKEVALAPGSPLVLTHTIKLVPSGSGSCGCEADVAALRERLERLEREVSDLREKCDGAGGSCCTSESKGAGCSIKPEGDECPNECSDQGRCEDGKCVCFPGHSGPDCSESSCPKNCNDRGKCVKGQCECDPEFSGPDCSQTACPGNCSRRGRCEKGKCVCDRGFTGPRCADRSCPGSCNRGSCVNGRCVCDPEFTGPDCSKKACPNDCNGHGRCESGKCVCDSGFTGANCSEMACPGNCNDRERCVNGQCICEDGFTGRDCSERTCPNGCSDRGRCENGRCECSPEFTGPDCSQTTCPDDCKNGGSCVDGQCVCQKDFTGPDCSEAACPGNCSNNGKCENGKCVCSVGFIGPKCGTQVCPNKCSNRGNCMRGRCLCQRGFTGKDCSQCEKGLTGPNCDTVMSDVSQLKAQNVTETSVSLVWTPPSVQYETYHIVFTSEKEGDQQIELQVGGHLTTFTQTGLAAGQKYRVSIVGELKGRRGIESNTEFMTLISGPTNLRVVKTTSTTAVVQWEPSQGAIDRYRLTISPLDGVGRTREMTVGPGESSALIQRLEAGRVYDIILVAEKGLSRSQPATTQAVPGKTIPGMEKEALALQVPQAPGEDISSTDQELNPSSKEKQSTTEDGGQADLVGFKSSSNPNRNYSSTVIARTKPLPGQILTGNVTRPKDAERATVSSTKFPNWHSYNRTRVAPGVRRVVSRHPIKSTKQAKPGVSNINDSVGVTSLDPPISAWRDATNPVVIPANESEPQKPEEPTSTLGSNVQPQGDTVELRRDTGILHNQENKYLNKMKGKHVRLPLRAKLSGSRENEEGQGESSMSTDLKAAPPQTVSDHDTTPDKPFSETFDSLNITTKSVLLSKPVNLSADAETVSKQITGGLKPLSSSSVSYSQPSLNSLNSKSASHANSLTPQRRMHYRGNTNRKYRRPQNKTHQQLRTPQDSRLNQTKQESLPSSSLPLAVNEMVRDKIANRRLTTGRRSDGAEHVPTERRRFVFPPPRRPPNPSFTRGQNQTFTNTEVLSLQTTNPKDAPPHDPEPKREERKWVGTGKSIPNLSSQHITRRNGRPLSLEPNLHRRPPYGGAYQNTRSMRPPHNRPIPKSLPTKMPSKTAVSQNDELKKNSTPDNQERGQSLNRSIHGSQKTQSGEKETVPIVENAQIDRDSANTRAQPPEMEREDNSLIDTEKTSEFHFQKEKTNSEGVGEKYKGISSHQTNYSEETIINPESEKTVGATKDATSAGEPLEFVKVTNRSTDGFTLTLGTPEGKFGHFVVSSTEAKKAEELPRKEAEQNNLTQEPKNGAIVDDNYVGRSTNGAKPTESKTVQPGSAQLHQFKDLPSQTQYNVPLPGMGPGLQSSQHKLVISTG